MIQRKMPMLVPIMKHAAQVMQHRMMAGYARMMNGGTPGGAKIYDPNAMEGVERQRY